MLSLINVWDVDKTAFWHALASKNQYYPYRGTFMNESSRRAEVLTNGSEMIDNFDNCSCSIRSFSSCSFDTWLFTWTSFVQWSPCSVIFSCWWQFEFTLKTFSLKINKRNKVDIFDVEFWIYFAPRMKLCLPSECNILYIDFALCVHNPFLKNLRWDDTYRKCYSVQKQSIITTL